MLRFVAFLLLLVASGCARRSTPTALDRLLPCNAEEGPTDAYCGTLRVFENRDTRQGRTIDLKIVVLPALSNDARPDPLFFLAGGPGQGAAQMARPIRESFRRVQTNRDVVLVDQRGTGESNPLDCKSDSDSLQELNESDLAGEERLRKCLRDYDADPRLYTTSIAMDDLDEVRAHLGYDKINLYGGSYGTRAALVYLRQHESNVRAVVLDGVAPPDMRLPLFFARDAERALHKLLGDCEADPTCQSKYPDLAGRTRKLFERLDKAPLHTRLTHPRTGLTETVDVNATLVASILVGALYTPMTSSLIPELIRRAEAEDFQSLLALASVGETARDNMSIGMQLSVVCAEDFPRIASEDIDRETTGRIFAAHLMRSRMRACEFWPKGTVPSAYYQPVVSSIPVLVLSGDLDPVTPPEWGDAVTRHLANARHIIVPGTGHGVISTGCGVRLIREFIERGSADGLDTTCVQVLKRPPFFLTPAGPDPAATRDPTP